MPNEGVTSGYYGIYRPPYSIKDPSVGGSIYVITSQYKNIMVLIPLVPNFFVDVIKIANRFPTCRDFSFLVPDVGPRFISDYLASWYYLKKTLGYRCKFYSKYLPKEHVSEEFLADFERNRSESWSLVIARDYINVSVINIQISQTFVSTTAPYACDVAVNDTIQRHLFVSEMNERKLLYLNEHRLYDAIHTPFIEGTYPTMTYNEIMRMCPGLVHEIIVDRFGSREELDSALARGVHTGRLVRI